LRVVEKIENVNARAKKSGLKVSGVIGCMKGNAYSSVVDDFELLSSTFKKNESVFDYDSTFSIFHSNLSEGTDMNEGSELGYHMLWALSHK
jgi:hypothetical protein